MNIQEQQKERYSKETKDQVRNYLFSEVVRIQDSLRHVSPNSTNEIILRAELTVINKMVGHLNKLWNNQL